MFASKPLSAEDNVHDCAVFSYKMEHYNHACVVYLIHIPHRKILLSRSFVLIYFPICRASIDLDPYYRLIHDLIVKL